MEMTLAVIHGKVYITVIQHQNPSPLVQLQPHSSALRTTSKLPHPSLANEIFNASSCSLSFDFMSIRKA